MFNLSEEHLYHYTSFISAIEIINSMELKFAEIERLNDINEMFGPEALLKDKRDEEELKNLMKCYTQISLTMDKTGLNHFGFDIPAMWGHYSEKGKGVCLIFDKGKIINEVRKRKIYSNAVSYTSIEDMNNILYDKDKYDNPSEFIDANKDELFFHKTKDWEHEQEFRIIAIDSNPKSFSINESLLGAILFCRSQSEMLKSSRFRVLTSLLDGLDVFRYMQINGVWNLYDRNNKNLRQQKEYNFAKYRFK